MIWIALIISLAVGIVFGLLTRSIGRGIRAGLITLVAGILLALIIIFSGLMGG